MIKNNILIFLSTLLFCQFTFSQIGVINYPSLIPDTLAQRVAGKGVDVFNADIQCSDNGMGYFFGGLSSDNLQINSGIILTTGNTAIAFSLNSSGNATAINNTAGDSDLEEFPQAYNGTYDACILEFDFVAFGTEISLNYIFGSEEYPEYVGSQYNDVMAIFIEGGAEYPSSMPIVDRNIALIPGTFTPVALNSLNSSYNSEFYLGNTSGDYVQYDGLTTKLTATATVTPCQIYHLKIAIADVNDAIFDSGLFIEEDSFQSNVPEMTTLSSTNQNSELAENCGEITYEISPSNTVENIPVVTSTNLSNNIYQLLLEGTATLGVDYTISTDNILLNPLTAQTLTITPIVDDIVEDEEYIIVAFLTDCINPAYWFLDTIYLKESLNLLTNTNISLCESGVAVPLSATGADSYNWVPTTGLSCIHCPNPMATVQNDITYTVFAETAGCVDQASIEITIDQNFDNASISSPQNICTTETFQFEVVGGVSYVWQAVTEGALDFLSCTDCPSPTFLPLEDTEGTFDYEVNIFSGANCSHILSTSISVVQPDVSVSEESLVICQGETATITATGTGAFIWTNENGSEISTGTELVVTPNISSVYQLTVLGNNCSNLQKTIHIEVDDLEADYTASETFVCEGEGVLLAAINGENNQWLDAEGSLLSSESILTVFPSNNTTYQLISYSGYCYDTTNVVIEVEPLRNIEFITSSPRICGEFNSVEIAVEPIPGITFEWTPAEYFTMSSTDGSIITATPPDGEASFTYTVTPVTLLGCSPSASIDVVVSENLDITVDAPEVICVDLANPSPININAFGATTYTWESPFGSLLANPGASQAIFIPNPANNDVVYTVYGENEDGTCTGEYSFQIQVFQEPEISVQIPIVCGGESSVLEVIIEGGSQDFEYEWIPTNGLSNPNSSSTEINIQEPTTYTLIVTDLVQGCEILQEVLVPVSNSLSLTESLQMCAGGEINLFIEGIEEGANIFWTDDVGNTYEGNNIEVSPSVTTNYYPTSNEFCFSNDAITVEVIDLNIQITSSKTTICKGETIELTATGAASFDWTPIEGINDQSNAFQIVSPDQNTTYLVGGFSANGSCVEYAEITIEVLSAEVLSPLNTQICGQGDAVQLEVNAGEMATYDWSPAMGLSSINTSMVTANPSETTLYNLQTTNMEGCEESFNFLVEVNELPNITISPSDLEVCQFLNQTFTLSGGIDYTFSAEEGQEFDIEYFPPNKYNITSMTNLNLTIEGTDENGCQNTTQANIEVTDPVLAISQGGLICVGESIELFADGGEGATYSWTPAGSLNDPTVANPIANPSEGTVYTVNITDASGCSGSGTIYIPVSFPIEGTLVSSEGNQVCEGTTTILSFENNSVNPYSYLWYDESGSLVAENTTGKLSVTSIVTTTYSVVIANEDGCQETKEITLTLNEPNIEVQNTTACIGGETIMTASGAGNEGTYEWQPAEFITCNNPGCSSVTIAAFAEETTMDFIITGTNTQGCSATTEANVFVSQDLILSISSSNPAFCVGESLTINAGGAVNFMWEGEGINSANGNSVVLDIAVPGVYIYTLTGFAGDCEATLDFPVTVNEVPQITVMDLNICKGENALLEASGTMGLTYQWFDANDEEITDLTISPNQTSSYTVLGTNPDGCQSSEVMIVNVSEVDFEVGAASIDICEGEIATLTPIGTEIVNYEWSTGVTTVEGESLELSPSTTSTYEVVATNTNGCTSTQQVTIEVHPDPVIELQENFLACADEALLVEATVESENGSLQWAPPMNFDNPNIANPTITSTTTSSYVLIATSEFDCATAATTTIEITDECVFPGDANNDGMVDMFDLFPLGVNFGASDLARNSVSNEWQGFGVADWTITQSNGQNLKYVDCNGDGSIGFEDTAAIVQNFDLFQKSGGFVKGSLGDPELRFVPDFGVIGVGEYLQIEVWLGSDENPATDLYAIAFETTFDVNLIDPNSISMDYSGSDLGTHNVDLLAVDLVNETTGRVNVSMSRTASPGANGSVYLLTIRMRTWENLDDINNFTFNISDFGATNSTEEPVLANLDDIPVIIINPDIVDIEGIHILSKPYDLYPTFTQDGFQLNYTLQKKPVIEVNLFALSGQKIGNLLKENQALGNHQEAVDLTKWGLTAGVYIVELQLEGEMYREKIVVF